jgi:formate hydrogenlyase transcriptional activator
MNKQIETIPSETMNALARWEWPGNVRELENFIERSVILSDGTILNVPVSELRPTYAGARHDVTLESLEREHILRMLRETGGVISGLRGAATRLGMKRTTLQSRMQKMGITRADYEN